MWAHFSFLFHPVIIPLDIFKVRQLSPSIMISLMDDAMSVHAPVLPAVTAQAPVRQ